MDSNRNGDSPEPVPATYRYGCVDHVWLQLSPTQAECQKCQLIVPTVPPKEA